MSTVQLLKSVAIAAVFMVFATGQASALELKPFKDALFAYPAILASEDNGDFITVDYQEMRDINGRDSVPEREVKGDYVSLGVRWKQDFEKIEVGGREIEIFRAGKIKNAAFAVIFIHGRGGDRKLGANDKRFGGNFNRLKNLAVDNGGVYLAPSVKSFDAAGAEEISALIGAVKANAPKARIVLSCASMGSFICWSIARDAKTVAELSGMMVMGGVSDPDFKASAAHQAKLPLFFSHGARDSVYAADQQVAAYRALKKEGYPSRFVLFETGSHGTPVRMTDWRDSLNWIFSR
ncbi:putative esterase [Rhizobium sp. SG_E_25_P2]|nr:putative esterase [Rhizobium sp. SG_E_25_P2]